VRSLANSRIVVALAGCVVTSAFFLDFCNFVYRCGCRSLWNGAAEACNIHSHGTHHCPWCSIGSAGALAVWLTVMIIQCLIAVRWTGLPVFLRLLLTLAAFPITGGLLALGLGLSLDYWV
jgi:hypothetical protein